MEKYKENSKILTKIFSKTILRLGLCTSVVAIASCGNNTFSHDSRCENLKGGLGDVITAKTGLQDVLKEMKEKKLSYSLELFVETDKDGVKQFLDRLKETPKDVQLFLGDLDEDLKTFDNNKEICALIKTLQNGIKSYVKNVKAQDPEEGDEKIKRENQKIVLSRKDIKAKKDDQNQQIVYYLGNSETVLYRSNSQNPEEITILQIPDNITNIDDSCFLHNTCFSEVKFPDSIEEIGENCFYYTNLTNIIWPANLKKIGSNAFSGTKLETITIPKQIKKIEEQTFGGCRQLTSITIYSTLEEICDNAFHCCEKLQDVIVADLNEGDTFNGLVPYFIKKILEEKHNINCPNFYIDAEDVAKGLIKIENGICYIPKGAKKIGKYGFLGHKEIERVELPDSLEKIGDSAFRLTKFESITIPENVKIIGDECFIYCDCLCEIVLPANLEKIGGRAFVATNLKSVQLSQNIKKYDCLVPIFIKQILEKQGIECSKCFADTEDIYRGIIEIDKYGHCSIPGDVTEIGNKCFQDFGILKSVDLPKSLTKIGDESFAESSLTSITLPPKTKQIGNSCFRDCKNLSWVTLSFALTEIGHNAFSYTGIQAIRIPEGVKVIRRGCFSFCKYLTSVIIYSPIIEIERDAFLFTKGVNIYLKKSTFEKLNGKNNLPERRQFFFMRENL